MGKKEAKFTKPLSVLITEETRYRLGIIAAREHISISDLTRRVLDSYADEHIVEVPTKQVVTKGIMHTLKDNAAKTIAKLSELDRKAIGRDVNIRNAFEKVAEALRGMRTELEQIRQALQMLPEMKESLDEFLTLWYQVPADEQSNPEHR